MTPGSRAVGDLGCYVVPGGVGDPRPALRQAQVAESLGLGTVWIGERYDNKDLAALAGALSQVTHRVRIGAAVTHPGLRHPMVLASMGQTLQALSDGRFLLGLGRSAPWRWRDYGATAPSLSSLADTAAILHRLWGRETVDYEGPAGRFPRLRLAQPGPEAPPPLLLAAVGPRTLALAGRSFDGVILHPLLTPEAVARSIAIVRGAAADAGREVSAVRCYATVIVAPDMDERDTELTVHARAAGYLHVRDLGDALVGANRWDPDELARYRSQPVLATLGDLQADKTLTRGQLIEATRSLPDGWLAASSAIGGLDECCARLTAYLDAGADELLLHGAAADRLGPLAARFGSDV